MRKLTKFGLFLAILGLLSLTQPGYAIHWFRGGPGTGCTSADGELTDDPLEDPDFVQGEIMARVQLWHNTFYDPLAPDLGMSGSQNNKYKNETRVKVGEAVKWTWNSAHCHSVQLRAGAPANMYSGYHYPEVPPVGPRVVPGAFEYPVLTDNPTLSFVHTFLVPGTYQYFCIHHQAIGMEAVVVVEP